ncbi:hypothetical protein [uncultured Campylobacter sp.]|uniref:hypothetical protein n=1 Tax=uncultured Campylobacter sp. TaxID=218934 RepID=UPI0026199DFE|nr:hypothetical protein [uncultured Campylobacter sp.]
MGIEFCSNADETACDNQQNFAKILQRVDRACLLCYLMHAVFIARTKGGVALGFDTRTKAIPLPILTARCVGMDYARVNLKFRQALLRRSGVELY